MYYCDWFMVLYMVGKKKIDINFMNFRSEKFLIILDDFFYLFFLGGKVCDEIIIDF